MNKPTSDVKVVAANRKATHDYSIEDRFEAGLALLGTEIKSIRAGQTNLREGYVQPRGDELFLVNVHVSPYDPAGREGHDPLRPRKLLLHRKEIARILTKLSEKGYTLIPLRMYLKNGRAKVEIALARGKRQYDKRQSIAARDAARQIDRTLKGGARMTVAERILTPDGTRFTAPDGSLLNSLATINQLPDEVRDQVYRTLVVDEMLDRYAIDRETLFNPQGERAVTFDTSPNIGLVELRIWRQLSDRDPLLYMQLADTTNNQIVILLFITSDPEAPRFPVDRDWGGEPTKFGTLSRNVEAEMAAMQAGLSPGQVRRGLRMARKTLPNFEQFISRLGHDLFMLEPLAYHSAILFESFGCMYSQGRKRMERIHQGFQPGGEYFVRLDGSTPFRQPGAEKTVRGRSWAIHDGILGEPYADYHMYKQIGKHAGVSTFPNYVW